LIRYFLSSQKNSELRNILVAGYPKSGTTWLCRMVSNVMEYKVGGLLGNVNIIPDLSDENKFSEKEGICYKTHLDYQSIKKYFNKPCDIVLIYRDPLDVIVSSINYWSFNRYPKMISFLSKVPTGLRWYYKFFETENYKKKQMVEVISRGSKLSPPVPPWCEKNWFDYNHSFLKKRKVIIVSYEDLLNDKTVLWRISQFLNSTKSESDIDLIYNSNKADALRRKFKKEKDAINLYHIRYASEGEGKVILDDETIRIVKVIFKEWKRSIQES
tara:strand:+ start:3386 stop:4198 length:813 start_codon:yes stop_codon:yes gene_type:complete